MIKRRSFLQGIAAGIAAILSPIKLKASEPPRLRVVIPNSSWVSGYGAKGFNDFINTPYSIRMSPPVFANEADMRAAIICDRNQAPIHLGQDKRQRWVDAVGNKHDNHLRDQIIEAIREHRPYASPIDGGAPTGA